MTFQPDENRISKQQKAKDLNFTFDKSPYIVVESNIGLQRFKVKERITFSGRVVEMRKKGKIIFIDLKGSISCSMFIQEMGSANAFEKFKELIDKGDYIRIYGVLQADNKIEIEFFDLLAKCLFILPKFLNDTYLKNNFRFLDAVINYKVSNVINNQTKVLKAVRTVLWENNFNEFNTPILSTQYNGGAATPFETQIRSLNKKGYLRVSSDIQLKMLIAAGQTKIFELGSQFRNEGLDNEHLPEFSMLEVYEIETKPEKLLKIALEIFERVAIAINQEAFFYNNDEKVNCSVKDWKQVNARNVILAETQIDILWEEKMLKQECLKHKITIEENASYATVVNKLIEKFVLRKAVQPTIVDGLPYGMTPLIKKGSDGFANRYWLFARQIDFCDIGFEENDYLSQVEALQTQHENLLNKKEHSQINEEIKNVVAFGLPPLSGIGMSISRMLMIFANSNDIRESSAFSFK